jgi:hypothetical protein
LRLKRELNAALKLEAGVTIKSELFFNEKLGKTRLDQPAGKTVFQDKTFFVQRNLSTTSLVFTMAHQIEREYGDQRYHRNPDANTVTQSRRYQPRQNTSSSKTSVKPHTLQRRNNSCHEPKRKTTPFACST